MWRWTVVLGVLVSLYMAWTPPGWAQGSFVPRDVGTETCRDVQLAVQGQVGNETNPPYPFHAQYVAAAVLAAKPALAAGEITGACYACIILPFAESIPINAQKPCGPGQCDAPGSAGWQNMVKPGGNGAFNSAATPQACCQACVANLNCAQWAFTGSCQHNVPPNQCVSPVFIAFPNSGHIRCPVP